MVNNWADDSDEDYDEEDYPQTADLGNTPGSAAAATNNSAATASKTTDNSSGVKDTADSSQVDFD